MDNHYDIPYVELNITGKQHLADDLSQMPKRRRARQQEDQEYRELNFDE